MHNDPKKLDTSATIHKRDSEQRQIQKGSSGQQGYAKSTEYSQMNYQEKSQ